MKKSILSLILLSTALLLVGQDAKEAIAGEAATLLQQKCFECHSPTASHDDRLAPPMVAVKMHYSGKYDTKAAFVDAVTAFALNPSADNAMMNGAVKNFKLMPKQAFSEDEVRLIAAFIYDNDLEAPDWFADHHPQMGMRHGKGNGKGMGKGMGQGKHKGQEGCAGCASGQCGHHGSN